MRPVREAAVHAVMGTVGAVCGVLSAMALLIAAIIPPILGFVSVLLLPLRPLIEWLQRPRGAQ